MEEIEKRIAKEIKDLEESFTYMEVLKDTPLMEATQAFRNKAGKLVSMSGRIWKDAPFPEREALFRELGEDYGKLLKMLHSDDALKPIFDSLKKIYDDLVRLRDMGLSEEEGKKKLVEIGEEAI